MEQRPEIWLWGINDKQQRILIIDRNFLTYFYLVMKKGQSPESIIKNRVPKNVRFSFNCQICTFETKILRKVR